MNVLNYGAGSVGLGLDSCLLKAGVPVTIISRPKTVEALKTRGLERAGIFGDFHARPETFACADSLDRLSAAPFDFVLVSVKSFDSKQAAVDLKKHPFVFHKKTAIVLCQNGWGNAEIFAKSFPQKRIFNARIITGFYRPEPHRVEVTVHADAIRMGSLFGGDLKNVLPLCQNISRGGVPCQISPDIGKDIWAKMFYNCALNPLGAVLGVPYGVLGKHSFSRALMDEIVREAFAVMRAAGYRTYWPSAPSYLKKFYSKFLPSTAAHRSSTLRDLKAGKPTEIDALTGVIIRLGKKFGVPTPVNRTLYQMVKFIEQSVHEKEQ